MIYKCSAFLICHRVPIRTSEKKHVGTEDVIRIRTRQTVKTLADSPSLSHAPRNPLILWSG